MVPTVVTFTSDGLNAVPKNVGPLVWYTGRLHEPLVTPAAGIGQLAATYHLGLPAESYVYHAAKMVDSRCVKSMPHPDSFGFHQSPLKGPGTLAVGAGEPE